MIGVPPSPIGMLFANLLATVDWGGRILFFMGLVLVGATLMHDCPCRAKATVTPPWIWQRVGLVLGLLFIAAIGIVLSVMVPPIPFSWFGFALWFVAMLGAGALARWGQVPRTWGYRFRPILEFLDLQWFYRSMWRGATNLLSVLRISAEVIEGSGAVMWSLLILLLTLLVIGSR
jgi:hypothetical protein